MQLEILIEYAKIPTLPGCPYGYDDFTLCTPEILVSWNSGAQDLWSKWS